MLEVQIDARAFEGARDYLMELDGLIEEELQRAFRSRIGPRLNRRAKEILRTKVYSVEIPFRKRLRGDLLEKAKRQVGGKTTEDTIKRVRAKFGGSSSGQPFRRWKRTGQLLANETWRELQGEIGIAMMNPQEYARPRNALGGPANINPSGRQAGEQSGKSGTREVHWQQEAAAAEADWIGQELAAAGRRAFARRR